MSPWHGGNPVINHWAQKTTDRANPFPLPTKFGRVYRDSLKGCYIGGGNPTPRQRFLAITEDIEMIGKRVIVRTYSAGVHFGELVSRDGKECTLKDARRLWYWNGSASLSQLAVDGTSKPNDCKFPVAVPEIMLTEAIEYIPVTEKAAASIDGVPVWTM